MDGGIGFEDLPIIKDIAEIEGSFAMVATVAMLILAEYFYITGIAYKVRKQVFDLNFTRQFVDEHKEAFGAAPAAYGYPDMGSGKHAERLSYKEWVVFNNAQRAHYNFLEDIMVILTFMFVAGISFPKTASTFGLLYFIGRWIYTAGYVSPKGADGRNLGATLMFFCKLAELVLAGYSGSLFLGLNDQAADADATTDADSDSQI